MGHVSGGGYASSPSDPKVLLDNISRWSKKWPLDAEGRFGKRRTDDVSEIITDDPHRTARQFFEALGRGGKYEQRSGGKYGTVELLMFDDRSHVSYRPETGSSRKLREDNPAVGIFIRISTSRHPGGYRIHFRRKRAVE